MGVPTVSVQEVPPRPAPGPGEQRRGAVLEPTCAAGNRPPHGLVPCGDRPPTGALQGAVEVVGPNLTSEADSGPKRSWRGAGTLLPGAALHFLRSPLQRCTAGVVITDEKAGKGLSSGKVYTSKTDTYNRPLNSIASVVALTLSILFFLPACGFCGMSDLATSSSHLCS